MCCRTHSSCISPSCCLSRSVDLTPPSSALKLLIPDTETGAREVPSGVQRHHQHSLRRNFRLHHLHERQGVPRHAPRHRAQDSIRLIFAISSAACLFCIALASAPLRPSRSAVEMGAYSCKCFCCPSAACSRHFQCEFENLEKAAFVLRLLAFAVDSSSRLFY
jgi:hypothetical protein